MADWLLRKVRRAYASVVSRRRLTRVEPVPYPSGLDEFAGMWVAVVDGEVRAASPTSSDLVYEMKKRDIRNATVEYVPTPSDGVKVGLG
jgi:hypothetical protein